MNLLEINDLLTEIRQQEDSLQWPVFNEALAWELGCTLQRGAELNQAAVHIEIEAFGRLLFVCANYHCRQGELDLIMREQQTLVFVEVRYRASRNYGGALSSVTPTKQQKIRHTARYYLMNQRINEAHQACRFDIVSYDDGQCNWLKNAF